MRVLTAAQRKVLEGTNRATHFRIRINPGTGFIDLTNLEGRDWVESFSYGGGTDVPVVTGNVVLRRQSDNFSLSPLVDGSKLNIGGALVDVSNEIIAEIATIGQDAEPEESDFVEVFRGEIDEINAPVNQVNISCRDQGHLLVDTFVEIQRVYGSVGGIAIETVIQSILDDNINTPALGSVTLFSVNGTGGTPFNPADSPGFLITKFILSKETVFSAIRRIVQMIGFDVKYVFHVNTSQFQLVLISPDRRLPAQGTLSFTGQPSDGETFVVNATTVTARTAAPGADEYLIGPDLSTTIFNLAAELNSGSESANIFANAQLVDSSVLIEWQTPGTVGNAIVLTEAITNATADGGGTLGGTQTGADGKTVPDFTFDQDHYFDLSKLAITRQDVRNVVRVTFADPTDDNIRVTISRSDAPSITKFGRRFMEITEDSNGQIDTVEEAVNFANFALRDLADADVVQGVNVPYFWPAEDFDLYRFTANGQHYDTDQDLAIRSFKHKLTRSSARTALEVRGKPAGGVQRWLAIEGNNITNPAIDLFGNDSAKGLVTEANVGVIIVTYDDPRAVQPPVNDWAYTECHVSETSGFTPSVTTLKAKGRQTRFEIGGLVPGDTFFIKLVIIDERGNVAATSAQATTATQRVGPFHENLDGQQDQLIRNNDFNIFTLGVNSPPDNWELVDATWQTDIDVVTAAADTLTGGNAIEANVRAASDPGIRTNFIPFTDDDLILVGAFIKGDVAEANTSVDLSVTWFDSAKSSISTDTTNVKAPNGSFEERNAAIFRAPTNTRYAKILIRGFHTGTDYDLNIDRVGAMRASPQAHRFTQSATNAFPVGANILMVPDFDGIAVEEIGLSYSAGVYTIEIPGPYIWNAGIFSTGNTNGVHEVEMRIEHDSGSGFVILANKREPSITFPGVGFPFGVVRFSSQIVEMAVGDKVRTQARVNIAAIGDAVQQGTNVFFSGKMMERNTK